MYVVASGGHHLTGSTAKGYVSAEDPASVIRGAFIPHATAKQARAFVRFWNKTEEERVEKLVEAIGSVDANDRATYLEMVDAVLAAITGGGK